jgi:hypothetical protein
MTNDEVRMTKQFRITNDESPSASSGPAKRRKGRSVIEQRAKRSSRKKFERALRQIPSVPPDERDRI